MHSRQQGSGQAQRFNGAEALLDKVEIFLQLKRRASFALGASREEGSNVGHRGVRVRQRRKDKGEGQLLNDARPLAIRLAEHTPDVLHHLNLSRRFVHGANASQQLHCRS